MKDLADFKMSKKLAVRRHSSSNSLHVACGVLTFSTIICPHWQHSVIYVWQYLSDDVVLYARLYLQMQWRRRSRVWIHNSELLRWDVVDGAKCSAGRRCDACIHLLPAISSLTQITGKGLFLAVYLCQLPPSLNDIPVSRHLQRILTL